MEIEIIKALQSVVSDFLITFTTIFSYMSNWIGFLFVLICFFMFCKWHFALCFGITYGIGFFIGQILKLIINRPRPFLADGSVLELMHSSGSSMPSGHTISAIIIVVFLVLLIWKKVKSKWLKILLMILFGLFVLIVMFSRMFLGVHYLSDVLVGLVIGLAVGILGLYFYHLILRRKRNVKYSENIKKN